MDAALAAMASATRPPASSLRMLDLLSCSDCRRAKPQISPHQFKSRPTAEQGSRGPREGACKPPVEGLGHLLERGPGQSNAMVADSRAGPQPEPTKRQSSTLDAV